VYYYFGQKHMQIYLVGGAVRDQLLGLPVKERDWVVVGATPELMLQQGFQQVGKDFPVFLHPKTREEYALARKERKTGQGYYGFDCDADPSVTLEEDLLRRDLTVNAMAIDSQGRIIDPFQGQRDLQQKWLRHVSDAFIEDPVRVLRLARFKARFHSLGFQIAPETHALIYQMVESGELAHLVPERVWQELERSLSESNPEQFIWVLRQSGALREIFPEIEALFGIPAAPDYHPEIDSGVHTLQVLQFAKQHAADRLLLFTALLHDLGKAQTPRAIWPSHAGHDERGVSIIQQFCERLKIPRNFREMAKMGCRYHLKIFKGEALSAEEVVDVLVGCGAFRQPYFLQQLIDLCEADARAANPEESFSQRVFWEQSFHRCLDIPIQAFVEQGLTGNAVKGKASER
jgi:tRNA nucleotidyltransferase (CCA-adding enzyme)